MTQVATPGRIVLYVLSAQDAAAINSRRIEVAQQTIGMTAHRLGNEAREGQLYPAMVVATFGGPTVNLQVLLDGSDSYWATSRAETDADGREPGRWFWPTRA